MPADDSVRPHDSQVSTPIGEDVRQNRPESSVRRLQARSLGVSPPKSGALHLAEKIRSAVEEQPCLFDGIEVHITVSVGVADLRDYINEVHKGEVPTNFDCLEMIRIADKRLYEAKDAGRNCVVG